MKRPCLGTNHSEDVRGDRTKGKANSELPASQPNACELGRLIGFNISERQQVFGKIDSLWTTGT